MKYDQEELMDQLIVSQIKYMICSICKQEIDFTNEHDEELMEEHFKEKHGLKDEE